jgi:TPR repeat protein
MNCCSIAPSLLFIPLVASFLAAQRPLDSNKNRLAVILRLPALTPDDWQSLFSEADSGNAEAQYWVGKIYDEGRLLPPDEEKAALWFQKSAEQGYGPAEYSVCKKRAGQDTIAVERCMWRAAENGVPEAQFWVGVGFEEHLFGVTDKQEALKWFRLAAEGGSLDAEYVLGLRYELGDGVKQNYALAANWFQKAAEHVPNLGGAGQGRNDLGILYMEGDGVPKDYVQACMWFILAGVETNIKYVQRKMTSAQIIRAQQLAEDWKKQHPDPAIY